MRILIIGGGIGGLAAAVALRQKGFDAHVYEQADALREVGAGLSLRPNAVRVLSSLGFGDKLAQIGLIPTAQNRYHWQTGEQISRTPLGDSVRQRFGFPNYTLHRAELHDALRSGLDEEAIHLGAKCTSVVQEGDEVIASFADGRVVSGDLLVGADGAGSLIRSYVAGPDCPIGPSMLAWRGLAPGDVGVRVGLDRGTHSFSGQGKFFLAYYVSRYSLVNWVGIMQPQGEWEGATRIVGGTREAALDDYEGWASAVRMLIAETAEVSKWQLYDGEALTSWTRGRVTLLGDAAHPMLPFASQGAGQAIEDAIILTRCLEYQPSELDAALTRYVGLRKDRATAVQERGRQSARHSMDIGGILAGASPVANQWVLEYDPLTVEISS